MPPPSEAAGDGGGAVVASPLCEGSEGWWGLPREPDLTLLWSGAAQRVESRSSQLVVGVHWGPSGGILPVCSQELGGGRERVLPPRCRRQVTPREGQP